MAVKVTGPGGFAGGPGSLLFMMLWIVSMVWRCVESNVWISHEASGTWQGYEGG